MDIDECSICMSTIDDGSIEMLPCSHNFHLRCLAKFRTQSIASGTIRFECPLCRAPLQWRTLGPVAPGTPLAKSVDAIDPLHEPEYHPSMDVPIGSRSFTGEDIDAMFLNSQERSSIVGEQERTRVVTTSLNPCLRLHNTTQARQGPAQQDMDRQVSLRESTDEIERNCSGFFFCSR